MEIVRLFGSPSGIAQQPIGLDLGLGSGAKIKRIQPGSITIGAGATSATATILEVIPANSACIWMGDRPVSGSNLPQGCCLVTLTNGTTVTATRADGTSYAAVVDYLVIEYTAGSIKSNQSGTVLCYQPGYDYDASITAVDITKAVVFPRGGTYTANFSDYPGQGHRLLLASATLVRFTTGNGFNANGNYIGGYQVIEYVA